MSGYDITSILQFRPPTLLCKRCRALLHGIPHNWEQKAAWCPVCKARYQPEPLEGYGGSDPQYPFYKAEQFLRDEKCSIEFADVMAHSKRLATLVVESRGARWSTPWPTMRLLLTALSEAKSFVHFASYGISHQLLGALKLTSMRVPVCGWASNVDSNTRAEMEEWETETPMLKAKAISSQYWRQDVPHQKLVIIDGLLAFTGSANLTNHGMRQVDRSFDIQSVVTDLTEVTRLNNTYFSSVWATIGGIPDPLVLMVEEPF